MFVVAGRGYDSSFRLGRKGEERELSFKQWVAVTGEKDAKYEKIDYPDADRSIEDYMRGLGYEGTDARLYSQFFKEVRTMRRGAWREEFTTRGINDFFREGFGTQRLPLDELPPVECGPFRPEFSYRKQCGSVCVFEAGVLLRQSDLGPFSCPSEEKEVALTIRNLNMLSWIGAQVSGDLPLNEEDVLNVRARRFIQDDPPGVATHPQKVFFAVRMRGDWFSHVWERFDG